MNKNYEQNKQNAIIAAKKFAIGLDKLFKEFDAEIPIYFAILIEDKPLAGDKKNSIAINKALHYVSLIGAGSGHNENIIPLS